MGRQRENPDFSDDENEDDGDCGVVTEADESGRGDVGDDKGTDDGEGGACEPLKRGDEGKHEPSDLQKIEETFLGEKMGEVGTIREQDIVFKLPEMNIREIYLPL